jgi:hypothetical protein
MKKEDPEHFKGKDALGHVVEAQAQGILSATEIHGAEIPGHISAGADAARETALVLALLGLILLPLPLFIEKQAILLAIFSLGWLVVTLRKITPGRRRGKMGD